MKNILMDTTDKIMLMRPSFIETVFSHLFAGLINYQIRTDKPSLDQLVKLDSYA